MNDSPIPMARYAAVPGGQLQYIVTETRYPSQPPALFDFRCDHPPMARSLLSVLARPHADCPAEAVMLYPDALVLDGKHILSREGVGVQESFAQVANEPWRHDYQRQQLARIAAGDVAVLPADGIPVAAIFKEYGDNFGHTLAETMPRLLHLAAMGLRRVRLLVPQDAAVHIEMVAFAARSLGIAAEFSVCPIGSILRVPALHWPSPVSRYPDLLSPTLLRLIDRMAAASPPAAAGPSRLFVIRPDWARRPLANRGEVLRAARARGFTVVEPSALPFPAQISLFRSARVVAGPMGAALTLALAMQPGGHLAVFDPGTADLFFWNAACLAGHDFTWAFTTPLVPARAEAFTAPMSIPPDLLEPVLDTLPPAPA